MQTSKQNQRMISIYIVSPIVSPVLNDEKNVLLPLTHSLTHSTRIPLYLSVPTTCLRHPSDIPLDDPHGRDIHFPPLDDVKGRRPQKDAAKHDDVPIHRVRLHRPRRREEAKDEKGHEEDERDGVDGRARAAEGPARRRQGFAAQALRQDAADG